MRTLLGKKGATSILEILIALVIAASLITIGMPSFVKLRSHIQLANAASELTGEMIKARMMAIKKNTNYTVAFNYTNNTFTVTPQSGTVTTFGTGWLRVDFYYDSTDPDVPPFAADKVVFHSDGSTDVEATTTGYKAAVYMKSDTGERRRVSVIGVTGKVTLERWAGSKWQSGV